METTYDDTLTPSVDQVLDLISKSFGLKVGFEGSFASSAPLKCPVSSAQHAPKRMKIFNDLLTFPPARRHLSDTKALRKKKKIISMLFLVSSRATRRTSADL